MQLLFHLFKIKLNLKKKNKKKVINIIPKAATSRVWDGDFGLLWKEKTNALPYIYSW